MQLAPIHRKALLVVGLVVALLASALLVLWPREPAYQRQPLSFWLDQLPSVVQPKMPGIAIVTSYQFPPSPEVRLTNPAAPAAVRALGARCLPILLARLETRRTPWTDLQTNLRAWAARKGLFWSPIPLSMPDLRRGQAVTALQQLGDAARPAVPTIIKLATTAHDQGVRGSAMEVLRTLSPDDYAKVTAEQASAKSATR